MTGVSGSNQQNAGAVLSGAGRWRAGLLVLGVLALAACEREPILPGERFDTRTPLEAAFPGGPGEVSTDAPAPITLPNAQRISDWGQRGLDSRNRLPHVALASAPTEVWATDIGQGNSRRQRISADPVAADGRVFTIDAEAGLQATSISTGAPIWQVDLTPDFDRGGGVSGGGLAVSGGQLFATTGYGELIALDPATGAVNWRQRLGSTLGAPMVSGGDVFVVSNSSEAWSVDAINGRLNWQIPVADAPQVLVGGAAPAMGDRYVILPFATGEIVASLPRTGVRVWGTFVAGGRLGAGYANLNDITSDPVVIGNTIYVGNQSGRVVALNARNGERIWTAREGAYSPVVVAGGSLFFVSDRNELIRLDADTGARVWGTELPLYVRQRERRRKAVFTHFGPLLAGGQLVVASGDGVVRMFSPESGELTRTLDLRGGAAAHPIVVDDTLLIVSRDGRLHAYR